MRPPRVVPTPPERGGEDPVGAGGSRSATRSGGFAARSRVETALRAGTRHTRCVETHRQPDVTGRPPPPRAVHTGKSPTLSMCRRRRPRRPVDRRGAPSDPPSATQRAPRPNELAWPKRGSHRANAATTPAGSPARFAQSELACGHEHAAGLGEGGVSGPAISERVTLLGSWNPFRPPPGPILHAIPPGGGAGDVSRPVIP